MEVIIGINNDKLSYEQNAEGMYDIMITHTVDDVKRKYKTVKHKFRTGFIYDSIKLLNRYTLRVSQTDSEGNKKFGLIVIYRDDLVLPCCFDKIKPYDNWVLQAFIGVQEYRIDRFGHVYTRKFWDLRNS